MAITEFLSLEKPAKEDRIKIDVLNDNTDEIDKQFKRNSIVLSTTGKNISVSATGPYYTVTNNNAATVQALLEGNSMLLDPGETFKMNKVATETFTLEVTCASDVTVTYFQRNKDYVDGSLASDLANYYDKSDSDSIFLKTLDFGNMRKEKSDSVCSVDLPLKYNAIGNPVEEYRIHGDTPQQTGAVSPDFPKSVSGTGDLITDEQSEHYSEYALPIVNNGVTYNAYLTAPLYMVNLQSDYVDYARQKVIRNVGIITYDGSTDEEWANTEYQKYRIALENLGGGTDASYPYDVLCDKLAKTSASGVGIWDDRIAICGGYVYVHFDDTMTDVTTFKTYLQSNPITVYYPLASEVTEDVIMPELPTISGENQLYVNTTVTPKNVVVGALMQYLTRKDMNDTFPGLDNVYTKLEVNSMVNSLNAEVVTKAESVNDINQINGNISLTLDDVPDGDGRKMAGLATETYVNSAIGNINSFNVLVVQSLPTVDIQQHTIYFVPKTPSENGDVYDEYMYINNAWEHIGTSEADLSNYYTKSEVNTAISNKADSTVLTAHTGNADIHVTSADKTAWNIIPKSKSIDQILGINVYKDFVVPLTEVTAGVENTYFYGKIFLKRTNGANDEITIINAMCGKRYNQEKAVYNIDASDVFTPIKPCVFSYNSKKYFGLHVNITSSEYEIFRVDARTTTNYNDIKMIFIYDTNAKQAINSEIYNSLDFATPGTSVNTNFYAIPQFVDSNYVKRKLLYFSSVPATLTSTGAAGEIAYDTKYLYMCTAANTWEKTAWDADVYSTTETVVGTYMGKPLYRKVVDCGALPNSTTKEVPHGVSNLNIITNISGTGWDSNGTTIPLPTASLTSPVVIYSDKSKIYITTITDRSISTNSNVTLEYTKTTDA